MSDNKYKTEVEKIVHIGEVNGGKESNIKNIIRKEELKKERMEMSTFYGKSCRDNIDRRSVLFYPRVTRTKSAY